MWSRSASKRWTRNPTRLVWRTSLDDRPLVLPARLRRRGWRGQSHHLPHNFGLWVHSPLRCCHCIPSGWGSACCNRWHLYSPCNDRQRSGRWRREGSTHKATPTVHTTPCKKEACNQNNLGALAPGSPARQQIQCISVMLHMAACAVRRIQEVNEVHGKACNRNLSCEVCSASCGKS